MPATYEPIASVTLGSDSNSVEFTSIPGTYTDLVVVSYTRAATASSMDALYMRFNSDTGTNYSKTALDGDGSTARSFRHSNEKFIWFSRYSGLFGTTDPVTGIWQIMSYANTNVHKTVLISGAEAAATVSRSVGLWRSTSAITTVTLFINSGTVNMKSGSTFSLYGIKAA